MQAVVKAGEVIVKPEEIGVLYGGNSSFDGLRAL